MRLDILVGMLLFIGAGILFSAISWFFLAGVSYFFALLGFGVLYK